MKTKFTLCMIFAATQIGFAQENKLWLSLGAGMTNTSSANKNNLMGNGTNLQADAFVPLYRKGWDGSVKGSGFTLGINISGNYTAIKNLSPNNADVASQYQIFGGSLGVASQSESKVSGSFSGLLGIQGRVALDKFNFSPSLNAGYLHFNQKGFVQDGSATINGQQQERDLVKAENQTTNGLVFKPQVKIGYNIGQNFTFFVSPSMSVGPEIKQTVQYLVPQGGFNDRNTYEVKQLANGTWESKTNSSRYKFTEINFGVSIAIGKKKASKTNVKPGGAVSSFYAKTAPVSSETPTSNKVTDFNTTRNNRERGQLKRPDTLHQEWDNIIAENISKAKNNADTTNGGMVTKAGVSTSRSGIIRTGNAKLTESKPQDTTPTTKAGISTSRSNIPRSSGSKGKLHENDNTDTENTDTTGASQRLSMTPTTTKQTQGKTFGEKVTNGLQTASNPTQPQGKSINEKGVKRSETAVLAKPGSPIGGIVVKGGKNPGGNLITTTTNGKGEFEFTATEAGNYKFSFTTPDEPNNPNQLKAQNNNTVRSNRTDNALKMDADTGSNLIPAINNISSRISASNANGNGTSNQTKAQNNNTVRSNRTDNAYKLNTDGSASNPQKVEAQDFNTTRNNKERGQELAAKPGSPIGGIVVKGGKNPSPGNGWGAINVISDENGEVIFNVTEPGEYKLQITAPEPNGKSINEKGVSATKSRRRVEVLKSNKNESQGKSISEKGVSSSKPKAKAQ